MGVGFKWANMVGKGASDPRPLSTSIMFLIVSLVLRIQASRPCYGGGFQVGLHGTKGCLRSEASLHKHYVFGCVTSLEDSGLSTLLWCCGSRANLVGKEALDLRTISTSIMFLIVSLVLRIEASWPCYGGGFQVG
jgi:hypothetical protein